MTEPGVYVPGAHGWLVEYTRTGGWPRLYWAEPLEPELGGRRLASLFDLPRRVAIWSTKAFVERRLREAFGSLPRARDAGYRPVRVDIAEAWEHDG